ncbi:MAG TPA: 6-carboxytetrahydropterin synthase [Chitinophagales bacterium]|jgi:6-pyruvoyltetrahydropterin/6-carboxytetrahydropterin synthase|nr:6-carboxytetrahydropterin synthase [Chitinophagales bacterium]MBP6155149.1 6-carboxytetrahydropterin synthase [Chitinophagales bacterium]HQV78205.1 6-carboxytetrahydropterin synthase [Chitinophagales bacterium]HQW79402.1 6-carboxytetrahydropterin synthase [Chitinophagales bacterium]HRB18644.1 6-carboxytetrahydropterin synthase [Chitinophagales bacterium]
MKKVAVIRRASFNAAHKLWNNDWSIEKNKEVFGLCANENFHGHNYTIEVKIIGEIQAETGYVIDLKIIKDIIKDEIEARFDHKNLNLDTTEFSQLNPTAENMVVVIYDLIRKRLDAQYDLFIKLWETEKNIVEYPV